MRILFSTESLPAYHNGMLLVRMQSTSAPIGRAAARAAMNAAPTAGLAALSYFERAGMVKRVMPVSRTPVSAALRSEMGIASTLLATSGRPGEASKDNTGVSIIELERNEDLPSLQLALAGDPNVAAVSKVPVRYLAAKRHIRTRRVPTARAAEKADTVIAATPPPESALWNLRKIRWAEARGLPNFKDANSIQVAVLDTGIDPDHPELVGRAKTYTHEHPDLPRASSSQDIIGHGTHVAGIIGASINNSLGINGICHCELHLWKIFDDVPDFIRTSPFSGKYIYVVNPVMYRRALADCLERGVDVVNLSIGGPGAPDAQERFLFEQLIANGTTVVAAMGNDRENGSPTSYPAAIPGVIAVGATGLDDTVTAFSNRGNHITISAPGQGIWSTLPTYPGQLEFEAIIGPDGKPREGRPVRREKNYDAWPGTSMAAPHVSGAVALLLAARGKMASSAVRDALMQTADKVAEMGGTTWHPDYGAGRLDLEALLR